MKKEASVPPIGHQSLYNQRLVFWKTHGRFSPTSSSFAAPSQEPASPHFYLPSSWWPVNPRRIPCNVFAQLNALSGLPIAVLPIQQTTKTINARSRNKLKKNPSRNPKINITITPFVKNSRCRPCPPWPQPSPLIQKPPKPPAANGRDRGRQRHRPQFDPIAKPPHASPLQVFVHVFVASPVNITGFRLLHPLIQD